MGYRDGASMRDKIIDELLDVLGNVQRDDIRYLGYEKKYDKNNPTKFVGQPKNKVVLATERFGPIELEFDGYIDGGRHEGRPEFDRHGNRDRGIQGRGPRQGW